MRARNAIGFGEQSSVFNTQTSNGRPATPPSPIATVSTAAGQGTILLQVLHSAYSGILGQPFPDLYEVEEQQSECICGC